MNLSIILRYSCLNAWPNFDHEHAGRYKLRETSQGNRRTLFRCSKAIKKIHKDGQSSKIGKTKISGKLNAVYSSGLEKGDKKDD